MKYIILAAGIGKRLRPLTSGMSKAMIPVANRPILEWTLKNIDSKDVFVVARRDQDIVENFDCNFIYQDEVKGTGHALLQAKKHVKGEFIVMNVDEFVTKDDLQRLEKTKGLAVACYPSKTPEFYGVLEVKDGKIVNIEEKPKNPKDNLVNSGIYKLDERIFSALEGLKPSPRGELELTDAINSLLSENVQAFQLSEWKTITYPWDLLDVNAFILEQHGSQISPSADIRSGAVIEEPVAIGDNAVVGPNCYVRKNSTIGRGCKVGNAVEIKNSIIMEKSFVSHLSYVGDSIVGRNCNIAAGSIFANLRLDDKTIGMNVENERVDSGHRKLGAVVGDNVKFGVNVTVMPGKKVWPNILVPPGITIKEDITKQPEMK